MKSNIIRNCSWFVALLLLFFDLFTSGWMLRGDQVSADLLIATSLLLTAPRKDGRNALYWVMTILAAILSVLAVWWGDKVVVSAVLAVILIIAALVRNTLEKYSSVRGLFKNEHVLTDLNDYSRMTGFVSCLVAMSLMLMSRHILAGVILALTYAVFYAGIGPEMLTGRKKKRQIQSLVHGQLKDTAVLEDAPPVPVVNRSMDILYKKLQRYMAEQRPFLNASLDLGMLAMAVGTNKCYLSRTVNTCSGMNFRQYLNYHRVCYAKDLLMQFPQKKIVEIAAESGFNSVVTFNMAFKLLSSCTPTEWRADRKTERLLARSKESLSSQKERERKHEYPAYLRDGRI